MSRSGWTVCLSLALVLAAPAPLRAQGDYVPDARASPDTLGPVRWGFSITPYIWSAGQKGRVDRLRQQCVTEAEAARLLHRDQDAVLDGPAQRLAQVTLRQLGCGTEQRVPDVSPGGRGQAQHALGRTI